MPGEGSGNAMALCGFIILVVILILVILILKRKGKRTPVGMSGYPAMPSPSELQPQMSPPPPPAYEPVHGEIPEESIHAGSYQFNCPDCGTAIYIDPSVKKVKCPKCGHTFRIKKD